MQTPEGIDRLSDVDRRIAAVLESRAMSPWVARALQGALLEDPVAALDSAEIVVELLGERAAASVDAYVEMACAGIID